MDMVRAARLRRIDEAEDSARELYNKMAGWNGDTAMTREEGCALAAALITGLQAARELL